MAIEEGIECPACSRAVAPRLLFTGERNPLAYRKAQHICPYCGVIMYETGGGVNWAAVFILLLVFGACALVILRLVMSRR
jgi:DNA-directed RNA polymerase subunit RPC12/RpoP